MTRTIAAIAGAATLANAASAQVTQDSTVTHTLTWSDVGGNANGIVEPGESVLFRLSESFTNQNTIGTYSPFPPGPGSGTIRGFGAGFLDLNGLGGAAGVWNVDPLFGYGIDPDWYLGGINPNGTSTNAGANLINISFGQFPLNNSSIVPTNPIANIWTGRWTPASYAVRTASFSLAPASAWGGIASSVIFRASPQPVGAACPSFFGSSLIPIAPAPPTCLLLAPLLFAGRRRSHIRNHP